VMAAEGARGLELRSTPTLVELLPTGHARVRRRLEDAHPDREIVGWYHTHPHYNANFSTMDIEEQSTWSDPDHIGIVYSGIDKVEPWGVYRGPRAILLRPEIDLREL